MNGLPLFRRRSRSAVYTLQAGDLDRLFIAVDGATARANGGMSNKRDKSLERTEFLHCLVRLAVAKYVNPGFMTDVSEAVERLCSADIAPKLGIELQDPNTFRRDLCYTEEVDNVLRRHEPSLKLLFGVLAKRPTKKENKSLGLLLSLGDWKVAVRRLELIGVDFAERDATRCFVFSRMCVIDGSSERGRLKEGSLPFEGFLEALCRVALLKALPTDEEMVENGFNPQSETYEYLEWLKYEEEMHTMICLIAIARRGDRRRGSSSAAPWTSCFSCCSIRSRIRSTTMTM